MTGLFDKLSKIGRLESLSQHVVKGVVHLCWLWVMWLSGVEMVGGNGRVGQPATISPGSIRAKAGETDG
ncbi:MAG: hypothetical protein GY943_03705 [Chloroflexi bacterium]|nr:hypothetical protein [Chloroflexota bacterium]